MSDPVTNLEIEDVLSSIRRLVSEDTGAEGDSQDTSRFVLTPALRVEDSEEEERAQAVVFTHSKSEPVQEGVETADSDEEAAPTPEPLVISEAWKVEPEHEEVAAEELVAEEQIEVAETLQDIDSVSLEDRIAELEVAVSHADDEWEPDGSEAETVQLPKRHLFEVVGDDHAETVQAHSEIPAEIESVFAEAEATKEEIAEAPMAVDVPNEVVAPLRLEGAFIPVADTPSADRRDEKEVQKQKLGDLTSDDLLLDEEVLREMVAEIVRQELQGSVGERMTRNVRRMVRREIQRALALKDFE